VVEPVEAVSYWADHSRLAVLLIAVLAAAVVREIVCWIVPQLYQRWRRRLRRRERHPLGHIEELRRRGGPPVC
jgi:hypothetical protein